ncbi:MAG TPA: hypothetical protein VH186_24845 [Chloroflexia bacterium]|nr:hypothetical protein [Chloroflexia bacterium]
MPFVIDKPEPQRGLAFHQRLLENDPVVTVEIAETYLPLLLKHLQRKYPKVDQDLLSDAATEAYFNYTNNPQSFKPELNTGNLLEYLKMSANGDVKNALARLKREQRQYIPPDEVELSLVAGNINIEEEIIGREEVTSRLIEFKQRLSGEFELITDNELDRKLLALMELKERRTAEYARLLGIEHLSLSEQQKIVKRHKDRLNLRRKRQQQRDSKVEESGSNNPEVSPTEDTSL